MNSTRKKARDVRRISDFQQIRTALNLYALDNGDLFPTGSYYTSWSGCGSYNWQTLQTILASYIPKLPFDPSGHVAGCPSPDPYWYAYLTNFNSMSIFSGSGFEGTCLGKTILFLNSTEANVANKQDCQFIEPLKSAYPNAMIMVIN